MTKLHIKCHVKLHTIKITCSSNKTFFKKADIAQTQIHTTGTPQAHHRYTTGILQKYCIRNVRWLYGETLQKYCIRNYRYTTEIPGPFKILY